MISELFFLLIGTCLLVVFYLLVKSAQKKPLTINSSDEENYAYLFPRLNWISVAISNAGATISIFIIILGAISVVLGWGTLAAFATILGVACGYFLLYISTIKLSNTANINKSYASYIDVVAKLNTTTERPINYWVIFPLILVLFFSLFSIITEIASIEIIINFLTTEPSEFLYSKPENPATDIYVNYQTNKTQINFKLVIFVACCLYIFRGGMPGVIRTDIFQFMIVLIGVVMGYYFFFWTHFDSTWNAIIEQFHFNSETALVSGVAFILNMIWPLGAVDMWVRSFGCLANKESDEAKRKKIVKKALTLTPILIILMVILTTAVGLTLRNDFHQLMKFSVSDKNIAKEQCGCNIVWNCNIDNKNLNSPFTNDYTSHYLERFCKNDTEAILLKPICKDELDELFPVQLEDTCKKHNGSKNLATQDYTNFTDSPVIIANFVISSLIDRKFSQDGQGLPITTILILIVLLAILICAVLTTIDAYVITIGQSIFSVTTKIPNLHPVLFEIGRPGITILIFSMIIYSVSATNAIKEEIYFSTGLIGFGCMLFLSAVAVVSTWVKRRAAFLIKGLTYAFIAWSLIAILHVYFVVKTGSPIEELINNLSSFELASQIKTRSKMLLFAVAFIFAVVLVELFIQAKYILKKTIQPVNT